VARLAMRDTCRDAKPRQRPVWKVAWGGSFERSLQVEGSGDVSHALYTRTVASSIRAAGASITGPLAVVSNGYGSAGL